MLSRTIGYKLQVIFTTVPPIGGPLYTFRCLQAPNSDWLEPAGWQEAVMTFDGVDARFYLQGFERERAPSAGMLGDL